MSGGPDDRLSGFPYCVANGQLFSPSQANHARQLAYLALQPGRTGSRIPHRAVCRHPGSAGPSACHGRARHRAGCNAGRCACYACSGRQRACCAGIAADHRCASRPAGTGDRCTHGPGAKRCRRSQRADNSCGTWADRIAGAARPGTRQRPQRAGCGGAAGRGAATDSPDAASRRACAAGRAFATRNPCRGRAAGLDACSGCCSSRQRAANQYRADGHRTGHRQRTAAEHAGRQHRRPARRPPPPHRPESPAGANGYATAPSHAALAACSRVTPSSTTTCSTRSKLR